MKHTVSLTENGRFRSLYSKGKSAADQNLAVYCRRNRLERSRLGITASAKIGGAVARNRARRLIREAYRLNEGKFLPGYDIVVVSRARVVTLGCREVALSLCSLGAKLGICRK